MQNIIKEKLLLTSLIGAFQIVVLLLPVHFLNEILLIKLDNVIVPMVIIPAISAFITGLSVYSTILKQAFAKIILSVPFTILFWYLQIEMKFSIRLLNRIIPNYEESSAGGNFAKFVILCSLAFSGFLVLVIFTVLSCVNIPDKIQAVLLNLQKYLTLPLCIAVIAIIIVFNNIMPMYNPIYG